MKDIKGFEGLYAITEDGKVWSHRRQKFLKTFIDDGYEVLNLTVNYVPYHKRVHRLVAEAYIPNPDNLPEVNHKDENKLNNCVDNLEWVSREQNVNWATGNERRAKALGHPVRCVETGEVYPSQIEAIRQTGIYGIDRVCAGKRKTAGGFHWEEIV